MGNIVPAGNTDGSGDIAIVSLVIPSRVRKYTENELQVFLRSFGYAGKQTTVRVRRRGTALDDPSGDVASLPITLTGGAQSASLTFRVDEHAEDFVVIVDALSEELSKRNNRVETRVEIDRTKVRVLYVTADRPSTSSSFLGSLFSITPATNDLAVGDVSVQSALQADEDVECTTLISVGGSTLRRVADRNGGLSSEGFPNTRAELFAFDCVIFCDVSPDVLEDEQQQWLAQWIDGRGGGLILCGAPALGSNGLSDSPLRSLLPFSTDPTKISRTAVPSTVTVNDASHPIWRLKIEQRLNAQLIDQLPQLAVSTTQLAAKPNATVLLQNQDDASPIMLSQRAGRGRTLVTSASLSGAALKQLSQSWGPQPERVAGKFWRNMVYWATEASSTGRRRLVATSSQRFYRPGQSVGVRAVAYDEAARRTNRYRIWAMLEPESLDDMSLYSPVLWPENVIRDSGEVGPRIAWGEELPLKPTADDNDYSLELMLSETTSGGDSGVRIELTAYEGSETGSSFNHGTQIDSTSLGIQILSDPFEQQNPLPNHELLAQVASLSGGTVLRDPSELSDLLRQRPQTEGPPTVNSQPAWNHWWLWMMLVGSLTTEWIWRRMTGLA